MLGSVKTNLPLLSLTSWVRVASSFLTWPLVVGLCTVGQILHKIVDALHPPDKARTLKVHGIAIYVPYIAAWYVCVLLNCYDINLNQPTNWGTTFICIC